MEQRKRHNYKKLKIWLIAMTITSDVFEILSKFPAEENMI